MYVSHETRLQLTAFSDSEASLKTVGLIYRKVNLASSHDVV